MKRILIAAVAMLGFAAAANAATLSVVSDKGTYNPGETIILTVTGDSEGAAANAIIGVLTYDAVLTDTVTSSQTVHTSFGGFVPWTPGVLVVSDGSATVFNQIGGITPAPVDQLQIATATLTASSAGVVTVNFSSTLNFFGITGAQPGVASFTIVPEPTTAALLGLGLFGLAVAGRRGN